MDLSRHAPPKRGLWRTASVSRATVHVAVRVWVLGLAMFLATPDAFSRAWGRPKTAQVTPGKRAKAKPDADLSRGGERKGGIEFALGSITAALTATLIGRGIWELVVAERTAKQCAAGTTDDPTCSFLGTKPGRGGQVAGGLSLAFAVPVGLASGFLFRYAVRIRRDYHRYQRDHADTPAVALSPWLGRSGGGVGVRLRF